MLDLKKINLWLLDMDGTLYLGDRLFPFTIPLLTLLKERGKKYLFMTNNSSKSVADYVKKLARLGIPAQESDFINSSMATAYYLEKHYKDRFMYVQGTRSLKDALRARGFRVTDVYSEDVNCVVTGFDTELTFQKLEDLSRILLTKEIPYIATNPDLVCPTEFGSVPDCGSVSEMLYNSTGRRPKFIGKPAPLMPQLAMETWGYAPEETIVIGDRIYTDIKSGLNAGTRTALVMSGETTPEILAASPDKPEAVYRDCGEILELLKA
ncbi:MAG: HAD-IIA family hydrolase [Clostridia bacterium]|nr:HAD-IIA family hydrolase [Clostridia bacterium]